MMLTDAPVQGEILHITDMTVWECWSRAVSLDRSNILTLNSKIIEMKWWKLFYGATERLNYVDCFPQSLAAEQTELREHTRLFGLCLQQIVILTYTHTHTHTYIYTQKLVKLVYHPFLLFTGICVLSACCYGFFFLTFVHQPLVCWSRRAQTKPETEDGNKSSVCVCVCVCVCVMWRWQKVESE